MKQNIFLACFKESLMLIKKNKALVLFILLVQLVFLSLLSFVFFNHSTEISQSAIAILDYAETLDLDETSVTTKLLKKEDIFGEDPLLVYREGRNIVTSLTLLLVYSLLIFIVFNGLNWALTDNMMNRKKAKDFFNYLAKFAITSLTYFLVVFLFLRAVTGNISLEDLQIRELLPLLLILVVFYFMFISLALTGKNGFKDIVKKTFMLGIRKWNIVILTYLINIFILVLVSALLFFSSELNIVILFLALMLFVLGFVYSRIFLVLVVNRLMAN